MIRDDVQAGAGFQTRRCQPGTSAASWERGGLNNSNLDSTLLQFESSDESGDARTQDHAVHAASDRPARVSAEYRLTTRESPRSAAQTPGISGKWQPGVLTGTRR